MKNIYKIVSLLIASLIVISNLSLYSEASISDPRDKLNQEIRNRFVEFTKDTVFPNTRYALYDKITLRNGQRAIPGSITLYVRSGGKLTIKSGSKLDIKGKVIIERGGEICISGGSLGLYGTLCNYGTITVEENGIFNVSGDYYSNADSVLKITGKVNFNKNDYTGTGYSLDELSDYIKNHDRYFDMNSYCISRTGNIIYFYYCIDNIKTDYFHKIDLDNKSYEKSYSLRVVYTDPNAGKIKKAVKLFIENDYWYNQYTDENEMIYVGVDCGFYYSYKTKSLSFDVNDGQELTGDSDSGGFFMSMFDSTVIEY